MKVEIDDKLVNGDVNAKTLFAVVVVDDEDTEDSRVELWRANDEDHLCSLVKATYVEEPDEDDDEPDPIEQLFDDDWGIKILPEKIGTILD